MNLNFENFKTSHTMLTSRFVRRIRRTDIGRIFSEFSSEIFQLVFPSIAILRNPDMAPNFLGHSPFPKKAIFPLRTNLISQKYLTWLGILLVCIFICDSFSLLWSFVRLCYDFVYQVNTKQSVSRKKLLIELNWFILNLI